MPMSRAGPADQMFERPSPFPVLSCPLPLALWCWRALHSLPGLHSVHFGLAVQGGEQRLAACGPQHVLHGHRGGQFSVQARQPRGCARTLRLG